MICAISAVSLRRRGLIQQHPYGYYLLARTYFDRIVLHSGFQAIENLLLLSRFAVYCQTGTSTWEIARNCIRLCVDMELHLNPFSPIDPVQEQRRRRLFWECYVLDRYSSTTLGRPFAISDSDIKVSLPSLLSDEDVRMRPAGKLDIDSATSPSPAMAVFVSFATLRQISSRIHSTFFTEHRHFTSGSPDGWMSRSGEHYVQMFSLLDELDRWRANVPVFFETSCLYQRLEWYDFLLEKERLFLFRGMMNVMPIRNGSPPLGLIRLYCDSATKAINLYANLYWAKLINCTRVYFQILFTAGLSLAHFAVGDSRQSQTTEENHGDVNTTQTLRTCSQLLASLSNLLPEAQPFARVFELVCENHVPRWSDRRQNATSAEEPVHGSMHASLSGLHDANAKTIPPISTYADPERPLDLTFGDWYTGDDLAFPGQLFADMETYASQFACGEFSDFDVDLSTWNPQYNGENTT